MKIKMCLTSISLMFFYSFLHFGQNEDRLLSLNSSTCIEARCTGSAYCNACKNCSRCAYCNSGGSCGVCEGRSSSTRYNSNRLKDRSNNSRGTGKSKHQSVRYNYNYPNDDNSNINPKRKLLGQKLLVNVEELNLRSEPNTSSFIVYKLSYMQELILLDIVEDWLKVQVVSNDIIGYVFNKYAFLNY